MTQEPTSYKVLVSEYPLTLEKVHKLRNLGLRVPFTPSDEMFNTYAYIPDTLQIKLSTIRDIHYFEVLDYPISKQELDKYDDSIKKFNSIQVGDLVRIKGYRNLVTKVISIDDINQTAMTEVNLRGYIYRFEEPLEKIFKSDIIYSNPHKEFTNKPHNKLFVDLSIFDKLQDEYLYTQSVFYFLLRLKLSYPNLEVILVNPKYNFNDLLGFTAVYGSIHGIKLNPKDFIFTEDLTIYNPTINLITYSTTRTVKFLVQITPDLFKQLTGFNNSAQLLLYQEVINQTKHLNLILDTRKLKQDIICTPHKVINKYNIKISAPDTNISIKPHKPFNLEETFKELIAEKHINIAENLDYYLSILKG